LIGQVLVAGGIAFHQRLNSLQGASATFSIGLRTFADSTECGQSALTAIVSPPHRDREKAFRATRHQCCGQPLSLHAPRVSAPRCVYMLSKLDVTMKARKLCKRPRSLKSSAVGAAAVAFIVTSIWPPPRG
jgi:hypothetical protein